VVSGLCEAIVVATGFPRRGGCSWSDPGDGLLRRQAVENGEGGKGGSCAADAAAAGNFDPFPGVCPAVGLAQGVEDVGMVDGDPRVGPADVPMSPRRHRAVGQERGEVRRAEGVALAPAADSRTGGKGDKPRVVQPSVGGHWLAHARRDRGVALARMVIKVVRGSAVPA